MLQNLKESGHLASDQVAPARIVQICNECRLEVDEVRQFRTDSDEQLPGPEFFAYLSFLAASSQQSVCVINPDYFAMHYSMSHKDNSRDLKDFILGDIHADRVLIPAPVMKERTYDLMRACYVHWVLTTRVFTNVVKCLAICTVFVLDDRGFCARSVV